MKHAHRFLGALMILSIVAVMAALPSNMAAPAGLAGRSATSPQESPISGQWVGEAIAPTLTQEVRDLPPYEVKPELDREINPRLTTDSNIDPNFRVESGIDPLLAVQEAAPEASPDAFGTPIFNFDGPGYQFLNPPDTNGDVGSNHYIQMVNATVVSIYNKNTGTLMQQFALTALGACATGNGDPIVLYDQLADRWMLSEFGPGNSICVFISQTADPQGAYYSYQFTTPGFPDYPKFGVWPDAYYMTTNESGSGVYALERADMLAGLPATSQRFVIADLPGFPFNAVTPADLDGMTPPPAGAPGLIMRHRDTEVHGPAGMPANDLLEIWAFDVDWVTPANSTFTQLPNIQVAEFSSDICGLSSFSAIGMPGVPQCSGSSLDPLREVIMFRLAYRNFGSHRTLVGNFVTDVNGNDLAGIRWFELRNTSGSWGLYQEGTYSPDGTNRWMGGIAMDGSGNIALGYNVSSTTNVYPGIRYVGRMVSDPLGTMPQGEYTLVNGTAANGSNRYGDYSAMAIDPVDDCTFWFTGQYNPASQWGTRIGAFRFDACGTTDFTLDVTPDAQQVCQPADATYVVNTAAVGGFSGSVNLSAAGNPGTATFTPNPVTPTGASSLVISGAGVGNYSFDVIGTSVLTSTLVHSETVGLEVVGAAPGAPTLVSPANGAINVPATPTLTWNTVAGASSYSFQVATDSGFSNVVASASGINGTSVALVTPLNTNTVYYWRVWADNACGAGGYSATWSFTTVAGPGDCSIGSTPNVLYSDGFEAGMGGWTLGSGSTGNTWAIATSNPHSGVQHMHANDPATVSDQRLVSPAFALPTGQNPVVLKFWHVPNMETSGTTACWDGGILEVSNNGGSTWTPVPNANLLLGGYTRTINSSGNPLGGMQGWCGGTSYMNTIADVSAYAGQTVQFRFRLGSDSSVSRPGWDLDDVMVQSCQTPTAVTLNDLSIEETAVPAPVAPIGALPAAVAAGLGMAVAAGYALRRKQ